MSQAGPPPAPPYVPVPGAQAPMEAPVRPAPLSGPSRPRIWTALLAPLFAMIGAIGLQVVVVVIMVVAYAVNDVGGFSGDEVEPWLMGVMATPAGLLAVIIPGQVAFLACAVLGAVLSPEPFRERLALRPSRLPPAALLLAPLGTLGAAAVGSILVGLVVPDDYEVTGPLKAIEDLFTYASATGMLVVILSLSIVPGLVEELLFRGYVQSRLLRRWPPWLAIGVTGLWFAAAHGDPVWALAVLPIGLWIGYVAWRAGSVWPACLCHFTVNAAMLSIQTTDLGEAANAAIFLASALGMIGAVVAIEVSSARRRRAGEMPGGA